MSVTSLALRHLAGWRRSSAHGSDVTGFGGGGRGCGLLALRRSQTERLQPARVGLSCVRNERTGPHTGHKTRPAGVIRG